MALDASPSRSRRRVLLSWVLLCAAPAFLLPGASSPVNDGTSRRAGLATVLGLIGSPASPVVAAPLAQRPFEWTFLWENPVAEEPKRKNLKAPEIAEILQKDLGRGKYILTGNLTSSIFADDCRFVDPNNAVSGLAQYRKALEFLFEPQESFLDLQSISVEDDATLRAKYVAGGVLKLPWRPQISPWSGNIRYSLNAEGLIQSQVDEWNITRFDAIRQTFTPRL